MVGGFVDGDEEVTRILPLFAGFGLRLLLPRGALLRASLLAEALDGGQDGARASLGASRASDGEPRVSGADEMPRAVCADAPRAGSAPGDGGERLGVDEVDERADRGAVVELEFVLEGAVAHLDGNVDGEGTLGGLVDVERGVVEGRLGVVDALAGRGAVERQLHLVVRALLLAELVGAVGGGDGRAGGGDGGGVDVGIGGDARGRVGRARGDAGRARGGRGGRSRAPTGGGPLRGWGIWRAPDFMGLALGLRALDESVRVRREHGAGDQRRDVLDLRGGSRGDARGGLGWHLASLCAGLLFLGRDDARAGVTCASFECRARVRA